MKAGTAEVAMAGVAEKVMGAAAMVVMVQTLSMCGKYDEGPEFLDEIYLQVSNK